MKKMKKLLSLLLAAVMMMAMNVTVFAAEGDTTNTGTTGTITVENPREGETYTAYKIFDVTYNEGKTAYAYTIDKNSEWYNAIKSYSGFTFTEINYSGVYNVTENKNFSAAGFAAELKENIDGKTGTTLTAEGDVVKATGLELGYYFVAGANAALCNLTTTDPDVTIYDKNDWPFEKTTNKNRDKSDVEIGETVTFTIKGKVPNTQGFSNYTYKISDTMTEGITFDENSSNFSIKVGETDLESDNYTLTPITYGNGFDLTIDVMKLQASVGKEIVITYRATVNESAVAKISRDSAKLEYSSDPINNTTTITTPIETTFYSAKIVIDECVSGDSDTKLSGGKFVLKNSENNFYKYDTVTKKVSWVFDQTEATEVTTDENGAAEFAGLKDGTYHLQQTEAPKGYNRITQDEIIRIDGSSATDANLTSLTSTADVYNNAGIILPGTGGIGTTIFYMLGGIFVLGAAIALIARKRMAAK